MSRANGCYTFFPSPGNNSYFNDLGEEGYVLAYMNGFEPGELQVYDLINNQQIAYIIFNSNSNCPLTGTYPITGSNAGGNATIVCGC